MPLPTACLLAALAGLAAAASDDALLRETFDGATPAGVTQPTRLTDGLGGRALAGSGLWRPAAPLALDPAGGTIELRLCLLRPAAEAGDWTLLRCRLPGGPADSYANGIHLIQGWGNGLFLLVGDRERRHAPLRFAGSAAWKPGEWHHCAATWSNPGPGQASVALWVDDRLVERRDHLSLDVDREAWRTAAAQGRLELCAGAVWGRPAPGAIDDLRFYAFPRTYRSDR
ncbi:MAG: LamG domain-containing protein [Planctomycetes bacterium]|nr:LamG domain-containing protein [Planctomycetota bacterium]